MTKDSSYPSMSVIFPMYDVPFDHLMKEEKSKLGQRWVIQYFEIRKNVAQLHLERQFNAHACKTNAFMQNVCIDLEYKKVSYFYWQ